MCLIRVSNGGLIWQRIRMILMKLLHRFLRVWIPFYQLTVVGEAVHVNDTIILPLVDVSFGVGAGAFAGDKKNNAGGGMGGKMSPSAVLVIQNGATKLVNIKNQDTVTKILDMVPDVVDRITGKFGDVKMDDDIDEAISDVTDEE